MIVRLEKYVGEYRIVSLASETSVKDDLLDDGLDVIYAVSYTHLRAHETDSYLVCRLLLEKKKKKKNHTMQRE